jgi:hypothetical protein
MIDSHSRHARSSARQDRRDRRERRRRRIVAIVAWTMALVVPAGLGYALWSANGTGSGAAKATSAVALTISTGTASGDLYPGFTGGDVFLEVSNPNPYAVDLTSAAFGTVTSSDPTNCPASNISTTSSASLSLHVAASSTDQAVTIPDVVTLDSSAPDGCQGVTFTIATTVSGSQSL